MRTPLFSVWYRASIPIFSAVCQEAESTLPQKQLQELTAESRLSEVHSYLSFPV
jgi:hypothetical protein